MLRDWPWLWLHPHRRPGPISRPTGGGIPSFVERSHVPSPDDWLLTPRARVSGSCGAGLPSERQTPARPKPCDQPTASEVQTQVRYREWSEQDLNLHSTECQPASSRPPCCDRHYSNRTGEYLGCRPMKGREGVHIAEATSRRSLPHQDSNLEPTH